MEFVQLASIFFASITAWCALFTVQILAQSKNTELLVSRPRIAPEETKITHKQGENVAIISTRVRNYGGREAVNCSASMVSYQTEEPSNRSETGYDLDYGEPLARSNHCVDDNESCISPNEEWTNTITVMKIPADLWPVWKHKRFHLCVQLRYTDPILNKISMPEIYTVTKSSGVEEEENFLYSCEQFELVDDLKRHARKEFEKLSK